MSKPEFTRKQKAVLTKIVITTLVDRVRMDEEQEPDGNAELNLWWMNYANIVGYVEGDFVARDVAEIFLEVLTTETFENDEGQMFSTQVPTVEEDGVVIRKKPTPTFDEVTTLFEQTSSIFNRKLKIVALIKMVVLYKFPFSHWYFELLEETAGTHKNK